MEDPDRHQEDRLKNLLLVILCLAATVAEAFDSEAWFARREILTREAERLQASYSNTFARVSEPAEKVIIPIETRSDGAITLKITADKAQIFISEDLVWAQGVVISKYDDNIREIARIESASCLFDRSTKSGWSEGKTRVKHGKSIFDGENIYFSSDEGYIMSLKRSRIISKDLKFGGVL